MRLRQAVIALLSLFSVGLSTETDQSPAAGPQSTVESPEFPGKFNINNYLPPDPLAPSDDQHSLPAIPQVAELPATVPTTHASPSERIALRLSMQGTPVDYTADIENLVSMIEKQKHWIENANIIRSRVEHQITDEENRLHENEAKMAELRSVMEQENNAIRKEKILTMIENAQAQMRLLEQQLDSMMDNPGKLALQQAVKQLASRLESLLIKTNAPVKLPDTQQQMMDLLGSSDLAATINATINVVSSLTTPPQPFPSQQPTPSLTVQPSFDATSAPTLTPMLDPSSVPTADPFTFPTADPSTFLTAEPSVVPTSVPGFDPSATPTASPQDAGTNAVPTSAPGASLLEHGVQVTSPLLRLQAAQQRFNAAVDRGNLLKQVSSQVLKLQKQLDEAKRAIATQQNEADKARFAAKALIRQLNEKHNTPRLGTKIKMVH